jgi:hypothetical protein
VEARRLGLSRSRRRGISLSQVTTSREEGAAKNQDTDGRGHRGNRGVEVDTGNLGF